MPDIINIHLPSKSAYLVLGEEGNKEAQDHKFFPIVLSADRVDSGSVFTSVCPNIFDKICICEYWLGRDSLVVYADSAWVDENRLDYCTDLLGNSFLTSKQLAKLLDVGVRDSSRVQLLVTSQNSGTRAAYERVLGVGNSHMLDKGSVFHQNYKVDGNKRYKIFLGCRYFAPQNESSYKSFLVEKDNHDQVLEGNYVYKDMFLYFPYYREPELGIPSCVLRFLNTLGCDYSERWKEINRGILVINPTEASFILKDKVYEDQRLAHFIDSIRTE
jgi:hypothetical protein